MEKKYFLTILLLLMAITISIAIYKSQELKRTYKAQVLQGLENIKKSQQSVITEDDIRHLPQPVHKYLRYVGVIGKEKIESVRVVCDGEFRPAPQKNWAKVETEQYNFFTEPTRIYYIGLKMSGVPVVGLHSYKDAKATMLIKLAGLFTVADGKGPIMNSAETVTVFNDMCILAPATLIDKRIEWEELDSLTVKATFKNKDNKISALLYFNEKGELINFISDDRYYSPTGDTYRKARWSTPVGDYKVINGLRLPTYGEAIWQFPEGDYCYAKLRIKDVEYNPKSFR
ncbi:hypothetical protein BR63_17210 [Thermanaerosceptrum fracticalcis]|uniref:Uncharacterized protein n=1 Tax=Thermanaerosceptrum fracticalcis TaxID=1712410 RepID=A0A7G6E6Z0_THEFR|nr:DUF6544 family protein [Thermanaerosceptrum fracticalcis]QNB47844.1 hypothetical protein BR63_17210 [Thermanaerosceptrum fracticalcis]